MIEEEGRGEEFERNPVNIPSYWIVFKPNPYAKIGTLFRRFQDGYEEVVRGPDGKMYGYDGLIYLHQTLSPFLMSVRKRGIDMGSARMDRRREMAKEGEF